VNPMLGGRTDECHFVNVRYRDFAELSPSRADRPDISDVGGNGTAVQWLARPVVYCTPHFVTS